MPGFLISNLVPTGGAARSTTAIVNATSTAGAAGITIGFPGGSSPSGTKVTNSGALTAGVLKNMLTISGTAGKMPQLALATNDATARTIRLKITIDGVVIYDITSASISTSGNGLLAAGTATASSIVDGEPLSWKTSCVVDIASSLTETDKIAIGYKYFTES